MLTVQTFVVAMYFLSLSFCVGLVIGEYLNNDIEIARYNLLYGPTEEK